MVKQNTALLIIVMFVASIIMAYSGISKIKQAIQSQVQTNAAVVNEVEAITTLQAKWEDKNKIKSSLTMFASHPKITKNEAKSGRHLMEFNGLNPDEMNDLANKLLNGEFVIRKLDIKRIDALQGFISVEIDL